MKQYCITIFSVFLLLAGLCDTFSVAHASPPPKGLQPLLDNGILKVGLSVADGSLQVTDLRTGQCWTQANLSPTTNMEQRVLSLSPDRHSAELTVTLQGVSREYKKAPIPFRITLKLDTGQADLTARFACSDTNAWREASYPYTFWKDGPETYNLYPHAEGLLVPVRKNAPSWMELPGGSFYGGVRSYLMCLGLVDLSSGEGLLTLLPSFESLNLRWRDWTAPNQQTLALPQLVWLSNKGRFDRPYDVTWSFSRQGGYVALAQRYRQYFAQKGFRKTLTEKASAIPALREIAGAPVMWTVTARTPDEVREMATILKTNGIDRCLFALPVIYAPQGLWTNLQALVSAAEYARAQGYHTYRYDQYRDTFKKGEPGLNVYHQVNTSAFPDRVVRTEGQKMVQAFGPHSGVICPHFFMPMAQEILPYEIKTFGHTAWFLDCLGSVEFNVESECYDSRHPCDKFFTRQEREKLMAYVNSLKCLAGSECGLDYLITYTHWFEGGTTLVSWVQKFPNQPMTATDSINDNSVQKLGQGMKELREAQPNAEVPFTVSQSTQYRIPFYSLCHHDEVILTWRWEDGMNQPLVYWQRKNLWSVLYGAPPMYRPGLNDMRRYQKEIGQTERYVSSWVRQVAFDALVSHRFVTPDRTVQESFFSSGKGAIVNFRREAFSLADGQTVPAIGYVTYRLQDGKRLYSPSPCKNVFME